METAIYIGLGIAIGFVLGYLYCRVKASSSFDASSQISLINDLSNQITQLKVKFEEMEKSRQLLEKRREKFEEERDKRFKSFIESVNNQIKEITEKTIMIDREKDKRIGELVEQMKRFFEEQRRHTEQFLLEQGKTREEIERIRDAQIEDMKRIISTFTKTVSGTKTRGITGENILKEVLKDSIRVGLVKTDLKTENGEVEFAWDLGDGKYIPIDSKMPEVTEILEKYSSATTAEEAQKYKRLLIDKVKKEITRVQKYQNLPNTINSCILVVPEAILETAPELVGIGAQKNVHVCSFKEALLVAQMLQEQYIRFKEEGEVGKYKQLIQTLLQILENVERKLETINRAMTMLRNSTEDIKLEISKGKREKQLLMYNHNGDNNHNNSPM